MNNRSYALDALRGYAILTMVLSATVVFGILPGWMYHAQTPPPSNAFNPNVPGLTWVDLVFPFFLFAMGAAFPFSVKRKIEKGEAKLKAIYEGFKRYILLTFFAIFTYHLAPWALTTPEASTSWWLALLAFALLFPMFMRIPLEMPKWAHSAIKVSAFILGGALMYYVDYKGYRAFDPHFADIIILIMGHMAGFGTLIYVFTLYNIKVRVYLLAILMGILLGSEMEGSINNAIVNYTPAGWLFRFEYLKYLFIIIPGSIAGEYLMASMINKVKEVSQPQTNNNLAAIALSLLCFGIILVNLCCLYNRWLIANLIINAVMLSAIYFLVRKCDSSFSDLWRKLFIAGTLFLILGLAFESFQGGIKKDPTTFSYLFTTAGLAFIALIFLSVICDYFKLYKICSFLIMPGQNPMVAYVATGLLTMPLLSLLGMNEYLGFFATSPFLGFMQGVLLTSMAIVITMFFTKIKWFWRT